MSQGKAHERDKDTIASVEALATFGVPQADIALYLGIDEKTLRKHYREELDLSKLKANATVAGFAYNLASGGAIKKGASYSECSRMAMFWLKTQAGFRETANLEHTHKKQTESVTENYTEEELQDDLKSRGLPTTIFL